MSSRITYNGKNLDITKDAYRMQIDMPRSVLRNQSASGIFETLNVKADVVVSIAFRNFINSNSTDATLKRNLQQWFVWAQNGGDWTFARDSGEVVSTTLTGAEAAGQTVIGLTSTTGIDANGFYVIRSATHAELVKVASVDSGVQVTLTETLNHAYPASSRFRSEQYWNGRLIDARNPVREMPYLHWDFELSFLEDVDDL